MIHSSIKSRSHEDISILHQFDNHPWNYLSDCGQASDLKVKECQAIKAIFISHMHIDHFINFDQLLRFQIGTGHNIVVCGPIGIAEQVQSKIKAYTWNLIETGSVSYQIREIQSEHLIQVYDLKPPKWELVPLQTITDGMLFSNEVFEVSFTILNHGIPSIAYLFQEHHRVNIDLAGTEFKGGPWIRQLKIAFEQKNNAAMIDLHGQKYVAKDLFHLLHVKAGYRVGVIMDHAANSDNHAKIIDLFQACDRVFIETFYKAADRDLAIKNLHSYSTMSAQVMRLANVKEPIPVHFSRRYDEEDIAELLAEFELEINII